MCKIKSTVELRLETCVNILTIKHLDTMSMYCTTEILLYQLNCMYFVMYLYVYVFAIFICFANEFLLRKIDDDDSILKNQCIRKGTRIDNKKNKKTVELYF